MSNVKRITLASVVLVGCAGVFALWSYSEFSKVTDQMATSVVPVMISQTPKQTIAATTTAVTPTPEASTQTQLPLVPPTLDFAFPIKESELSQGCVYPVSFTSSTTLETLATTLVDSGTGKRVGPGTANLAATTTVSDQKFDWKVGTAWPGKYYLLISNINGIAVKFRSGTFTINPKPEGENQCSEIN